MISCIEFRREVLTDPESLAAPLTLHLRDCPECHHYYQGLLAQEEMLKAVLEVPIPESLPAKIRLRQRFEETEKVSLLTRASRWWPLALAASLLLGIFWFQSPTSNHPLAEQVLAHVQEDQSAMVAGQVTPRRLHEVLQRVHFDLNTQAAEDTLGTFSFAGNCVVDGKLTAHLVLHTEQGMITLLLMPEQKLDAAVQLAQGGWQAELEPLGNNAVVAVIGEVGVDLKPYQHRLREQVRTLVL